MKRRVTAGIAVCAVGGVSVAGAAGGSHAKARSSAASSSRLDDGNSLLSRSKLSEQQAIAAAQTAASGAGCVAGHRRTSARPNVGDSNRTGRS